jgi:hypothetical protein
VAGHNKLLKRRRTRKSGKRQLERARKAAKKVYNQGKKK